MDKVTEKMMMEREPVHPKCLGKGFTEEEEAFLRAPRCKFIESIPVFEIIDEETGQIDEEAEVGETNADEACRCKAYVNPSNWWKPGRRCPLADHYRPDLQTKATRKRVGQQKQKKH